jgi:hypothetical protein
VKVVELLPDGIVTVLADRLATDVLELATFTTTPLAGAVAFNFTVATDVCPLVMLTGFKTIDEIAGGFTVSITVCCTPL